MKSKLFVGLVALVALLAGCATPGTPIADFGLAFGEYDGEPVFLDGQVGRGIQVTGTSVYLTLLEGDGTRVPMLTATPYAYGERLTVLARGYAYDAAPFAEMDDSIKNAISDFVATVEPGDEAQIDFQTRSVAQFLKTFTIGSGSEYFIIEVISAQE